MTETVCGEEYFRSVLECVADPVSVVDDAGSVLYANRAHERVIGYSPEELVGMRFCELIHPDDVERVCAFFDDVRERPGTPEAASIELRIRHRDGSWHTVAVVGETLVGDPEVRGVVVTARDITAELALESQLRQAQKMDAVGRLAGGVAHDFNNLLMVIDLHGELLLQELAADGPAREDVEEIRRATARAAGLTRQLLAFSRKQVLQPKVVGLNDVVTGVEKMLRRLIGDDVKIVTALDPRLGAVKADPGQLEQVLMNLAVNARDAMPMGGTLTISTSNVEVGAGAGIGLPPGGAVALTVSDTGCGMSAEVRARIFEPFFTTKETGRGTGLGLATVYGIVTQSGGSIHVESELGQGASFVVTLPRVAAAPEFVATVASPSATRESAGTILLAEDEPAVRALMRRVLGRNGYTVLEGSDGVDAIRLCLDYAGEIDLLVTDVVMPEMSGRELATRVASLRPTTKVLYMSGYTDDTVVRHGVQQCDVDFLQKPFTADALLEKVRQILAAPATAQL